ncbi:hypothetical protein [Absidia glauca]|uniref:J domain-containing protein n=1 Tax=Absidia glauca TaxID=4829 RepID=A0A163KA06_ABSGL|nr:hypothetical protein [Absidia glauca]
MHLLLRNQTKNSTESRANQKHKTGNYEQGVKLFGDAFGRALHLTFRLITVRRHRFYLATTRLTTTDCRVEKQLNWILATLRLCVLNVSLKELMLKQVDYVNSLVLVDSQTPPDALLFRARVKAIMQNPLYGGSLPYDPDFAQSLNLYTQEMPSKPACMGCLDSSPGNSVMNAKFYSNRTCRITKACDFWHWDSDLAKGIQSAWYMVKKQAAIINGGSRCKHSVTFLGKAESEFKKSLRKDYYKVTQRPQGETEIKKAYLKFALQHHPDKNTGDDSDDDHAETLIQESGSSLCYSQ